MSEVAAVAVPAPVEAPAPAVSTSNNGEAAPPSTTTTDDKRTDQNDRFSLKVKAAYILDQRAPSLGPIPEDRKQEGAPAAAGADDRDNNDKNARQSGKKRRKNKGGNKRPRDERQDDSEKICMAVLKGNPCPWGATNCRFSHDVKAFMATRPEDITEVEGGCPLFNQYGYCPYGATCRLGSSHITKAGENVRKEAGDDDKEVRKKEPGLHLLISKEVQSQLRKKTFPFKCKRHFEGNGKDKRGDTPKETKDSEISVTAPPATGSNGVEKAVAPVPTSTTTLSSSTPVELKTRKIIDFSNKVYVAPLTTVGNLPFRRVMKKFGADITCGEMAVGTCLLEGKPSEWALLKRHPDEDVFGIQIAAAHPDQFTRVSELIEQFAEPDFVDLNLGCPLDLVCQKGAGAALMMKDRKLKGALEGITSVLSCPVTIKIRTGWDINHPFAHQLVPKIQKWGIDGVGAIMMHGRSRLQRYQKLANWEYISEVALSQSDDCPKIPVIGNGDIFSYEDYEEKMKYKGLSKTAMLGRGALIKPWLPTEIKERRHWDISASERLDILKDFVRFGLEHWGSDQQGVNNTRRFLLEWLSFLHRYVPVGLLEVLPQQMNHRPPTHLCGRSALETLFLSQHSADWITISEMLLGPVPEGFQFQPKHKASGYTQSDR